MNRSKIIIAHTVLFFFSMSAKSQDPLPYYEVPEYPESYNAGTVAARIIDGLGFRFYWATEGLRSEDLAYKPSTEARSSEETIDHIYGMSKMIVNATQALVNKRTEDTLSFEVKRERALRNLKTASDILKQTDNLDAMKIVFENPNGRMEYPFWNHLNGPIADCIWHVGQIVTFRRSSGNPIAANVSFFNGKVKE
jgi:hypothetical protein